MHKDINHLIGGIGTATALCLQQKDLEPITLSIGPLSGIFPYASKTLSLYLDLNGKLNESIVGGSLALALKTSSLDNVVFVKRSKIPIAAIVNNLQVEFLEIKSSKDLNQFKERGPSNKKSLLEFSSKGIVDSYFSFGNEKLSSLAKKKNLLGAIFVGSSSFKIFNLEYYKKIYFDLLARALDLDVEFAGHKSCSGCPAGCKLSKKGEENINIGVLPRCLVSCAYSSKIYKDIPLVFSCLESLGYHYTHEDLENISNIVGELKNEFK